MSRASVSCFGKSEDSDLTGPNPGRVKQMTLKLIFDTSITWRSALFKNVFNFTFIFYIIGIGQGLGGSVSGKCDLSGISGHGAGGLVA